MFKKLRIPLRNSLALLVAFFSIHACQNQQADAPKINKNSNVHSTKSTPAIIATWPHLEATAPAMKSILNDKSSLDAVEQVARIVEADSTDQSVGIGGIPDRDGNVTLDACIMDEKGNAGAVTYLQNIKHPISVARKVMEETIHVMLSGEGAFQFALEQGFEKVDLRTPASMKRWKEIQAEYDEKAPKANIDQHDTVGVLAIDKKGNMSGACSTSGMANKVPGRVGDSPIIGAGLYVDNEVGGAAATGVGELVMKTLGSFLVVELMRHGKTPQQACEAAVHRIVNRYHKEGDEPLQVGFIAMNKKGEHGAFSVVEGFSYTLFQGEKNEVLDSEFILGAAEEGE